MLMFISKALNQLSLYSSLAVLQAKENMVSFFMYFPVRPDIIYIQAQEQSKINYLLSKQK